MEPPVNFNNPRWGEFAAKDAFHIHDWRTYTTHEIRDKWNNFSQYQRMIIAAMLQNIADREEWE